MLKRPKTFKGGYVFKRLRGTPTLRIEEAPHPQRVVIPLKQEVSPTVEVGQKVRAGQIIGQRETVPFPPVHATVNGTIADIADINYRNQKVKAVIIEADGSRDWIKLDGVAADFENQNPDEIWQILHRAGVTSLIATPTSLQKTTVLVVNAVASEPFALPNRALLSGRIAAFITGLKVLRHALSGVNIHVGIDKQDGASIREMEQVARDCPWLRIHPLGPKYPQGHEAILVKTILGKEIPFGKEAADIGVVVVDVQTVLAACEAVVEGKPLIERAVALGGSAFRENVALRVRVGTPLESIITPRLRPGAEARIILGNVLTQPPEEDLSIPIDRTLSAIIALEENREREFLCFMRTGLDRDSYSRAYLSSFLPLRYKRSDTNLHGELRPCIFCNYCEEVCPVGIIPHLLSNYVIHDQVDETPRFRIQACIECGLCSYVCPAKIPLMAHIQQGKQQIREEMEHDQAVATAS